MAMVGTGQTSSWRNNFHPSIITMAFLGFSAGLPILLIFSSLSLWLGEAGVEKKAVTYFSWAALGYSFKFIWAPLIDKLPLPVLTRVLGRRRSWLLISQLMIMTAIGWMAMTDPSKGADSLTMMAFAAVLLGFSSATQDVVIDAYRIEAAESRFQAMMSAVYIAGYRVGMIVAGAGALFIAAELGTTKENYIYSAWQTTYLIMALVMLVGMVTTLIMREPQQDLSQSNYTYETSDYLRLLALFVAGIVAFVALFGTLLPVVVDPIKEALGNGPLVKFLMESVRMLGSLAGALVFGGGLVLLGVVNRAMAYDTWVAPILDFFKRYGLQVAILLLLLVGFYRISDIVLGVVSNVFYQDLGYSKTEIALAVKTMGLWLSILGGIAGGLLATRFGVMPILMIGAVLAAGTNLLFVVLELVASHTFDTQLFDGIVIIASQLAESGRNDLVMTFWNNIVSIENLELFWWVVATDNFVAGLASAAFIAFLSSLTNVSFTAVQYAIFSSLMTLLPKVLGGYSGSIVETIGYSGFFLFTAVIGLPVLLLVWFAWHHLEIDGSK